MSAVLTRPTLLESQPAADPCAHCDARPSSVCNAIGERDLSRLAALTQVVEAAPGHTFISEGEPASHFFNITRGTAKLFKLLPDGRRQITGFATAGHFLGLAVSDTYAFSAEALEPTRYCRFPRNKLRGLLRDFPAMEARLLEVASNELVAAQEQMLLLGRKTARERLASFLVTLYRHSAPCGRTRTRFPLPMTRGDIADYLGLTIETVSRTLTVLRKEGLIDIPGPGVLIIANAAALERVAGGLN